MKALLFLLVTAVILLHQDFWNWTNKTLLLGFVPLGLAYHAFYSILAACTMAVIVHSLWPRELDDESETAPIEATTDTTR